MEAFCREIKGNSCGEAFSGEFGVKRKPEETGEREQIKGKSRWLSYCFTKKSNGSFTEKVEVVLTEVFFLLLVIKEYYLWHWVSLQGSAVRCYSLFVNSCDLQWFFFQEMFFFWMAMHFKRMLWISLLQIYLLQKELWKSIGRLFLQYIWEWYEMPYKQMSIYKKQKSYRKFIFIVQYPMESPGSFALWGLGWTCKVVYFLLLWREVFAFQNCFCCFQSQSGSETPTWKL